MSRILAYTSPARGHLYPLVAILLELQQRGHEVHVRTLAAEVPTMRGLGFVAAPIDPAVEAVTMRDWTARSAPAALKASVGAFVSRAPHDGADLQRAITEVKPDVVVVDINSWGALAAAEQWGGPWASFAPYPLPLPSRDAPPFGPGLAPAAGPGGRLRDRVLRPLVTGAMSRAMLPGVNQVRAGFDRPPLRHLADVFNGPPLVLALTAEPFEYPRDDWPESVRLVGACEWEPPADETIQAVPTDDRPLVVVSTSSEFQDDGRLVTTALRALADAPVQVVATVPAAADLPTDVPANAQVARFLPHGPLLDRAACAVTHGGMGVTQKALARGVPVVAVPFGRDQYEVARRVEVAGAGVRLPARRLTADRLAGAVRTATAMRPGAVRAAAGLAAAGGPVAAADHLQSLGALARA